MKKIAITIFLFSGFILNGAINNPRIYHVEWEQLSNDLKFNVALEKEEFSNLDREARIVFAVEKGKAIKSLDEISIACRISSMDTSSAIFEKEMPVEKGITVMEFGLEDLNPGNYKVSGEVKHAGKILKTEEKVFRCVKESAPANRGKIPLLFSATMPLKESFPVSFGMPFPKGALWDEKNVRIVDRKGNEIPCQKTVRSRWGYSSKSSIRWLGIDFQPQELKPDWINKSQPSYFVEFGPQIKPASFSGMKIEETPEFYNVDTGKAKFVIRKKAWNLIDSVSLKETEVFKNSPDQGFYLIDHQGDIYRACNDREVKVEIEEKGPLKTVFRAEGWYVKDGADGNTVIYRLPTDKLCKFITRIEIYSGKPYVRILHTIVFTFDSYAVRLKDIGLSLFSPAGKNIFFGIENEAPFKTDFQKGGSVYLIQHLPDRFSIESSSGKTIREGKHSQGWFALEKNDNIIIAINHRETWQRFPKEFEVTSDSIKLHIWPLHGKIHPEINELNPQKIYKLWFAHQGKELNLAMPWKYFFKAAEMYDGPQTGVYTAPGLVLAGVHSSILGAALTSDILISFSDKNEGIEKQKELSDCFQAFFHCLADPQWTCDSLAVGYISPYSPDRFKQIEDCVEKLVKGYRELQDYTGQYGMWIYRTWHHTSYKGDKTFDLYRLFNATHHYEAFMPWLLYVRSGDPFYLEQARANTRLLSDLNIIHYDDPSCERRELHFNQKNIVGSTRHTNGFCPWGGDHGLLAHLTCYNALILAHYLTGDLWLKEIIVDQWQRTIVSDRKNPEFQGAIRLEPGRDNNNALGELIDLYQMTYHPALLVYIDDCLKKFLTNMYHWGQPLHNVLLFYKSQQARKQLMD
ncbi:MAG: hypothetical protein NC830_05130, partial [Candidatus Omnitrophica bacterium]|nr:hypothetical protein [Candidatus Omnitrophota bacterium]